ncbi:hypothetical protein BKA66DRAFT_455847 [Pyrenochaeta sp. MPI-SDFR-AT-0127]|nr:hypothetical protein BKA66DRAFT_455847 [Pyrenochaeta sp. MPI-SDFR-AT-0127]
MTSSRATSPAISSLLSCSQVIRVDDASETTLAPFESVSIDKEVRCEFDIDWTNIWHGSTRLEGAKNHGYSDTAPAWNAKERDIGSVSFAT